MRIVAMRGSLLRGNTARLALVVAAVTVITSACGSGASPAPSTLAQNGRQVQSQNEAQVEAVVTSTMAHMTLEDKVEQMFVSIVYGQTATTEDAADVAGNHKEYGPTVDNGAQLLATYHLGGIIYFGGGNGVPNNFGTPEQIGALSNGLQQASPIPLQISTDQEGGVVNRIGAPLAVSPGNMAIGATFDHNNSASAARVSGTELRALGINMDDAPVVDVNTNPANSADGARSFSDHTDVVSTFGADAITAYQDAGVAAQAKHFPGLGDTTTNTDNAPAVTNETLDQIRARDLPPFQAAINAGVLSVMAAHIVAPALDPTRLPASLSQPIVTGLLRNQLHFDGVVTTDALRAGALANIPQDQVILDAVNAGDDELLMPTNLPSAVTTLVNAVQNGAVSQGRIDQSVKRILRMKAELGLFKNAMTTPAGISKNVGTQAHLDPMSGIAARSITLLRNNDLLLPLNPHSGKHVLVTGWGQAATQTLSDDLRAKGLTVQRVWTGVPDPGDITAAVSAAANNDLIVVTTNDVFTDPKQNQEQLMTALLGTGKPLIVAAVAGPYDVRYFSTIGTYVAAYGFQPVSMHALANVLTGTKPTGRLPVTVPTLDGSGTLLGYGSGLHY
jgi:beta-N-acetylhexosaminidase